MAISTSAGAKFFIGPSVNPDAIEALSEAAALAAFEAVIEGDWTEVDEVESLGEVGDSAEVANFSSLGKRRVRKLKTVFDAGTMAIMVGRDPLDPGQIAMEDAQKTDFNYRFRIQYNDARDENHSISTDYFAGQVLSRQVNIGSATDITKRSFNVAVNTAIYSDPSDPTGS